MEKRIGEHETKYVFPHHQAGKLVSWLKDRCVADPEYAEGMVSSIYFDSGDWRMLHEKINSDYLKTKIRLRWYSDHVSGRPLPANFLEVKYKVGSSRQKVRLASGLETEWITATPLSDRGFLVVLRQLQQHGVRPQGVVYPALQIDYTRFRFVDPLSGARLCIDGDIRVARCNPDMLGRMRPYPLKTAVFELKERTGRLPAWLQQLTAFGCRRAAFSKYGACWQHMTQQLL